jgi:hypothetical protein
MADLSTLQIQITASTTKADTAIERLKKSLTGLNDALNKYSEGSEYAKGLEILTQGLNGVADAVNGIDTDKIKAVSSAIGSLSTASGKLSELSKAFSDIGNANVQDPFKGIITGLESLQSISIDEGQFRGVKTLTESFGKLAGVNAPVVASNLPTLANGLQMIAAIDIPAGLGDQLINLGLAVGKLGGKYATNAQGLVWVAEGINGLSSATKNMPDIEALRELASAVAAFGRQSAGNAIANLPALATGFRNLIDTLASAPAVSHNVIELANALARLAAAGGRVGTSAASGAKSLKLFGTTARSAKRHFTSLAATFGRLYANFFLIIRGARLLKKAIDISSDLREVQNVVATTFGDATGKVQDFADTAILSFGMSELSAKQFASRFQAMGVAMGVTSKQVSAASDFIANAVSRNQRAYTNLGDSMADVSINLTKLAADMGSFYNADYADVAEDLAAVMTGMTRPLRKYGLDLTEATLKEWALSHGLDGNIKKMTQAEKTMLRYQYVMANMGHVMGDFEKTQNTWANVVRTIGQQFQALGKLIGEALISRFKPVLIAFREFMNTLLNLTEKALNAVGKLMGWQVEIENVGVTMDDGMEDYADAVDDAAGNAKKLLKMLLPIDELNVLNDGGNGGSGSDVTGGGSGITNALTGGDLSIKPYESDIESWGELGRRIRDTITDGLDSINWNEIEGKVNAMALRLAFFLNGILAPDENGDYKLGESIGKFLANSINMGFQWLYMFASTFEWEDLGKTISTAINTFFETFNPELAADAINSFAQGIWTAIKTALFSDENGEGGLDKDLLKEKLERFFSGLDGETWGIIIGAITIKSVGKWLIGQHLMVKLGNAIATKIATSGGTVVKNISTAFGTLLKNGLAGVGGLKNFLTLDMAALVGDGAVSLGTMIGVSIASAIASAIAGFWAGKKLGEILFPQDKAFYEDFSWFGDGGFFETLTSSIEDGSISGAFDLMRQDVQDFFVEWKKAADDFTAEYFPWLIKLENGFKEYGDNLRNGFVEVTNQIKTNILLIAEAPKLLLQAVSNWWTNTAVPWFNNTLIGQLVGIFKNPEWKDAIKNQFGIMWDLVEFLWDGVVKPWFDQTLIGQLINIFANGGWKQSIVDQFQWIWDTVQTIFNKDWTLKSPHISWEPGGYEATGLFRDALELLGLPTSLPKFNIEWYANGGYPTPGSLFVAGEAGAEMVGSIGGKTAVASNGEITGIASAIYETASQTNALLRGVISAIDNKETGISSDAIFSSVRSSAKSYRMRTGSDAFV